MLPHPYFFHKLFVDFPGASELAICLISDNDDDDNDNDDDDGYPANSHQSYSHQVGI